MDLHPESEAALDQAGRAIADAWTATDFESLVTLYVGGDLEPVEARAMRIWLARHPEQGPGVEAALAARQVLLASASRLGLEGPDLWPNVRSVLHAEGWIGVAPESVASAAPPLRLTHETQSGSSTASTRPRSVRRFAASATAAAAALLCTAGLAWMLGFGEGAASTPGSATPGNASDRGAIAHRDGVPASTGDHSRSPVEALAGSAPDVRLVAQPELPTGVVRLTAAEGPSMEEHAVDVDLGNYYPGVVFPIGRPTPSNASVVGGVESTGNVFLVAPRRR
jgi:hypothetical protein